MNYKYIFARQSTDQQRILKVCHDATNLPGIYIFYREENGIKYAYVGQALNVLRRLTQHLENYQHIDLSIKKHGLFSEKKPFGYKIKVIYCLKEELNDLEQYYIKEYANMGYQLRNKTTGSQGEGKQGINDEQSTRGYLEGQRNGYEKCRKKIAAYFEKYFSGVTIKEEHRTKDGNFNKTVLKMRDKFMNWLGNKGEQK